MPKLCIQDYSLDVHLGVSKEERRVVQEVRISLDLNFPNAVKACTTDKIEDTICYGTLCERLKEKIQSKEFLTVEAMAETARAFLLDILPNDISFVVRIHKVRPPVDRLNGGVVFELESSS